MIESNWFGGLGMKYGILFAVMLAVLFSAGWGKGSAYIDDLAVYEDAGDGTGYKLDHQNITGPYGQEGRILNDGASTKTFFKDHLGSTRVVMNDGGGAQESYEYYSYGNIITKLGFQRPTRERFTGKEFDEDGKTSGTTGMQLSYFGARYYDPDIGLWITPDPKWQFSSPYSYTGNGFNPVNSTDKDGKGIDPVTAAWGAVAVSPIAFHNLYLAQFEFYKNNEDNVPNYLAASGLGAYAFIMTELSGTLGIPYLGPVLGPAIVGTATSVATDVTAQKVSAPQAPVDWDHVSSEGTKGFVTGAFAGIGGALAGRFFGAYSSAELGATVVDGPAAFIGNFLGGAATEAVRNQNLSCPDDGSF